MEEFKGRWWFWSVMHVSLQNLWQDQSLVKPKPLTGQRRQHL